MPEFNRVFSEGKMNRDLDERLMPQGQYREGVNIEVTSSKNGNVGSVKNRKGNLVLPNASFPEALGLSFQAVCVDYLIAEENQKVYYFVKNAKVDDGSTLIGVTCDALIEWDVNNLSVNGGFRVIFNDVRFLRISPGATTTGFTINNNNISFTINAALLTAPELPMPTVIRSQMELSNGNPFIKYVNPVPNAFTFIFGDPSGLNTPELAGPEGITLKKESVLGINKSNKYIASNYIDGLIFFTNGIDEPKKINVEASAQGSSTGSFTFVNHTSIVSDLVFAGNLAVEQENVTVIKKNPDIPLNVTLATSLDSEGATTNVTVGLAPGVGVVGDPEPFQYLSAANQDPPSVGTIFNFQSLGANGFKVGQVIDFIDAENNFPNEPVQFVVNEIINSTDFNASLSTQLQDASVNEAHYVEFQSNTFKVASVSLDKSLHEDKFVRFSYRWRYRDGEYSGFAPFTNVCFLPGAYEYDSIDSQNNAIINRTKQIVLSDFFLYHTPKDVEEIELLFKEENLSTVYSVRSFNINDLEVQKPGTGKHKGVYTSDAETFSQAINPNQILRPFDQVPRSAKAQEVSANRIIYGNIKENYDLTSVGKKVNADIRAGITSEALDYSYISFNNDFENFATGFTIADATYYIESFDQAPGYVGFPGADLFNPVISGQNNIDLTGDNISNIYPYDLILGYDGNDLPGTYTIQPVLSDYEDTIIDDMTGTPLVDAALNSPQTLGVKSLKGAFPHGDAEGPPTVSEANPEGNFNHGQADNPVEGDGIYHVAFSGNFNVKASIGAKGIVKNQIADGSANANFENWGTVLDDKYASLPLRLTMQVSIDGGPFENIANSGPYIPWKSSSPYLSFGTEGADASSPGYNDSIIRFLYHPRFPGYSNVDKPSNTQSLQTLHGNAYDDFDIGGGYVDPTEIYDNNNIDHLFEDDHLDSVFTNLNPIAKKILIETDFQPIAFINSITQSSGPSTYFGKANKILKNTIDFWWEAEWHDTLIGQPHPVYKINANVTLSAGDRFRFVLQRDPVTVALRGDANCEIHLQNFNYNFRSSNVNLSSAELWPWFNPEYTGASVFNFISVPQNTGATANSSNDSKNFNYMIRNWFGYGPADSMSPDLAPDLDSIYLNYNSALLDSSFPDGEIGVNTRFKNAITFVNPLNNFSQSWNHFNTVHCNQNDLEQKFILIGGIDEQMETSFGTIGSQFQPDPNAIYRTIVEGGKPESHRLLPTPIDNNNYNNIPLQILTLNAPDTNVGINNPNNLGAPSIKSFRTYKIGIVYRDKLGRETPVLPSKDNIVIDNVASDTINRLKLTCNHNAPDFADSYKFFIKETSSEYYNLVIDRIYNGGENTVWISFNSVDRNKITEETILIFKKQHGTNFMAVSDVLVAGVLDINNPNLEYPIISISNEAPPEVLDQAGIDADFDRYTSDTDFRKIQGRFFVKVRVDEQFKANVVGDPGGDGVLITLSDNPGVFETKAIENKDLDIYYEASQAFPIELTNENVDRFIQVGASVTGLFLDNATGALYRGSNGHPILDKAFLTDAIEVVATNGSFTSGTSGMASACEVSLSSPVTIFPLFVDGIVINYNPGDKFFIEFGNPNGTTVTCEVTTVAEVPFGASSNKVYLNRFTHPVANFNHKTTISFPWFNCFAFANGVESNRIRDKFNQPFISNGVKASTVFEDYSEEINKNKLTFSGIYNSKSSVNKTNQFIIGEGITKELNPDYGQIQRLLTRDTDLIAFCEDKVLRILSNKDALFNADGNTNVVASKNVLGTATPFVGEYGISYHPESVAKYGYRVYFTDTKRGKVLRLSMDGLTPISDYGMSDFFFDTFSKTNADSKIIGSYDNAQGEYNLTIPVTSEDTSGNYGYVGSSTTYIAPLFAKDIGGYTISFDEKNNGWVSFRSYVKEAGFSLNDKYYTFKNAKIFQHQSNALRSNYYGVQFDSSIKFIFNDASNIVKSFKTVNYEGTQAKIYQSLSNDEYYDNAAKPGWYVQRIATDIQDGQVINFVNKENKWFKYITGASNSLLDLSELTAQGFGAPTSVELGDTTNGGGVNGDGVAVVIEPQEPPVEIIEGCTNPLAENYDSQANVDNETCVILGCLDPNDENYNSEANVDDGSCAGVPVEIEGCTSSTAVNYDPFATQDDGSCIEPVPNVVYGCTNPSALNFNELATDDDGTCIILGCTDPDANNFNPQATEEDPDNPCEFPVIFGCTDPSANNYNANATDDDGTCTFTILGCTDPTATNYILPIGDPLVDVNTDDGSCIFPVQGCTDSLADNFNADADEDDGTCQYCELIDIEFFYSVVQQPSSSDSSDGIININYELNFPLGWQGGLPGGGAIQRVLITPDGQEIQDFNNGVFSNLQAGTYTYEVRNTNPESNLDTNFYPYNPDCLHTFTFELTPEFGAFFTWVNSINPDTGNPSVDGEVGGSINFTPANQLDAGTDQYIAELTFDENIGYGVFMQVQINGGISFDDVVFAYKLPSGEFTLEPPSWLVINSFEVNADNPNVAILFFSVQANPGAEFGRLACITAMIPNPDNETGEPLIGYADLIVNHPNAEGSILELPIGWPENVDESSFDAPPVGQGYTYDFTFLSVLPVSYSPGLQLPPPELAGQSGYTAYLTLSDNGEASFNIRVEYEFGPNNFDGFNNSDEILDNEKILYKHGDTSGGTVNFSPTPPDWINVSNIQPIGNVQGKITFDVQQNNTGLPRYVIYNVITPYFNADGSLADPAVNYAKLIIRQPNAAGENVGQIDDDAFFLGQQADNFFYF